MEEEFVEEVAVVDRGGWRRQQETRRGFMGSNSNSARCQCGTWRSELTHARMRYGAGRNENNTALRMNL